jgi:NADPH-dependent methylglyoxal reductase
MNSQKVLLTGATGSLGADVLKLLLSEGHDVSAVVRSLAKSKTSLEQTYSRETASQQLELIEIHDLAAPHAFDVPASKVDAIIHIATPLTDSDFQKTMIEPTDAITISVLEAAAKSTTVKRVIITSSIVTLLRLPEDVPSGKTFSVKDYNTTTLEEAVQNLPKAYQYSKTQSEIKAWEWMQNRKPKFDLITLLAPAISGRSIQDGYKPDKTSLGGMSMIYNALFDVEKPGFIFPQFMLDLHQDISIC